MNIYKIIIKSYSKYFYSLYQTESFLSLIRFCPKKNAKISDNFMDEIQTQKCCTRVAPR